MKNLIISLTVLFSWTTSNGPDKRTTSYHFSFGLGLGAEAYDASKLDFGAYVIQGESKFFYDLNSISLGLGISQSIYRNWNLQNEKIHLYYYALSSEIYYTLPKTNGWYVSGGIQYPLTINDDVYNQVLPEIGLYNQENQIRFISPMLEIGYGFKTSRSWAEVGLSYKHVRFKNKYRLSRNGNGPDFYRVDNIYLNPITLTYRIKIGKL